MPADRVDDHQPPAWRTGKRERVALGRIVTARSCATARPGDVAGDERADLDVPDDVRRRTARCSASTSTVPNRSQPKPNGSDASEITYWPLDDEQREVVRDRVDERDRHEALA